MNGRGQGVASARRQGGVVLLLMLIVVLLGSATLLVGRLNQAAELRQNRAQDVKALAAARQALLGAAVIDPAQPGRLPCPDADDDGLAEAACAAAASRLGRFPWRSLNAGDLRDSAGERLWYAVSNSHRPGGSVRLNSDTAGGLSVDGSADVVAVLLAPGAPLTGQNRANSNSRNAYLEDDNNDLDASYVTQAPPPPPGDPPAFNDAVLAVTRGELMQAVERRVLAEVRRALLNYYALNNYFPYAAVIGDGGYNCANTLTRGALPLASGAPPLPFAACGGVPNLAADLPAWFLANDWAAVTYYTVAPGCTPGTVNCSGAGRLTVTNLTPPGNQQALVIAAGQALGGQARPPGAVNDWLDSAENSDGDDVYTAVAVSAASNDQLRVVAP
ncbi:MAG TPA: hypothetical protein ENJ19_08375 [Gammaproteobacteria bacterium]|nr:hypothetical protein [Gammaproteobacteria bacterium]